MVKLQTYDLVCMLCKWKTRAGQEGGRERAYWHIIMAHIWPHVDENTDRRLEDFETYMGYWKHIEGHKGKVIDVNPCVKCGQPAEDRLTCPSCWFAEHSKVVQIIKDAPDQ